MTKLLLDDGTALVDAGVFQGGKVKHTCRKECGKPEP
jgi:hypothetical protein